MFSLTFIFLHIRLKWGFLIQTLDKSIENKFDRHHWRWYPFWSFAKLCQMCLKAPLFGSRVLKWTHAQTSTRTHASKGTLVEFYAKQRLCSHLSNSVCSYTRMRRYNSIYLAMKQTQGKHRYVHCSFDSRGVEN